ncbi:hypothetical protein GU3_10315 [Oceanimonas sp. GK1]|uniref:hypothetical protein n=1 Tax=Oceanimonas sp. (strain GK1 / IBRC-M 10197) TaxID=511062 RepID=UPI0002495187|nr:hypothetical protein [Oceanimonas sp. GK1]AEY01819.1 hypothetical protein GU3_10315 [Oceanimonas sp. GK1]
MSMMHVMAVIQVTKGFGVSRKSGVPKPYDFAQLTYLVPAKSITKEETNIINYGYDSRDIGVMNTPETIETLKSIPFMQPVKLVLEADPENPSRNVVVGWEAA